MPNQITSLRDSLFSSFTVFMNFIPTLIGGFLVLAIGWMVSNWVARLAERLLVTLKVDHVAERTGLSQFMIGPHGQFNVSYGISFLAKWFIRLLCVQAVANLFQMPQITAIMNSILLLIPNLAVGLLIVMAGLYFGQFVSGIVRETALKAGVSRPGVFALICRYGIVGFSIIAALNHIGIAAVAVNVLFIGFVASLSLALGLAFGLGGQTVAGEITRTWYNSNKRGRLTSVPGGQSQQGGTKKSSSDQDTERPAAIF